MQQLAVNMVVNGQQQAGQALDSTASKFERFKAKVGNKNVQLGATLAIGGIIAAGKKFGDVASDVQQAMGGVESVFGKNAATVKAWADQAAQSVGLAKDEYATLATRFGAQFKNMGLSQDKVLGGTDKMVKLGADLAATYGGSTKEAVEALSSAFRGEADPVERYGLNLSQTAINAELAARGQSKLTGTALTAAKAQATMDLATKQAGGSIGQFARESDTAAGAQERANAEWRNTQAQLGAGLLPIMQTFGIIVGKVSAFIAQNAGAVRIMAGVILGAAVAIKILNAAMNASPIARIIALVALFAAGLVYLWNKSETFRNIVTGVWNVVKNVAVTAWNIIKGIITTVWNIVSGIWRGASGFFSGLFNGIAGVVRTVWNGISTAITAVVDVIKGIWNGITGFFSSLFGGIGAFAAVVWNGISSAITAVVGVIKGIWNGITGFFSGLFSGVANFAKDTWDGIVGGVQAAMDAIGKLWDKIRGTKEIAGEATTVNLDTSTAEGRINQLKLSMLQAQSIARTLSSIASSVGSIGGLFGTGAGGDLPLLNGPTNHYGGDTVTIHVTGAGDPDRVARSIGDLLTRRARRTGGVRL